MNGEINWSQPIEAVSGTGGAVYPAIWDQGNSRRYVTFNGNRLLCDDIGNTGYGWRIRNVATPPADARTAPSGGEVGPEVVPMVEGMTVAEFHAFTVSLLGSVKEAGGDMLTALRDASVAGINARGRALEKEAGR